MSASAPASASELSPPGSVPVAVDLGWAMVELYATAHHRGEASEPAGELPTSSDLAAGEKTHVDIDHVRACVKRLEADISAAGLPIPSLSTVDDAWASGSPAALRSAIWNLHGDLFRCLHATDAALGMAYDLGRSLAYTCRRPQGDWSSLRAEFQEFRLANLLEWLADLASALPAHAARSVAISLSIWQRSIPDPDERQHVRRLPKDITPERLGAELRRQSHLWRAVLTGTKDGRDMLGPNDYTTAAGRLIGRSATVVWAFLWRTYFVIPIALAAGAFGIDRLVTSHAAQTTKLVGVAIAAAAALGISWKGIGTAAGSLAAKLEQPLWQAELDAAIGIALTVLERTRRSQWLADRPKQIVAADAPPAGPRASAQQAPTLP